MCLSTQIEHMGHYADSDNEIDLGELYEWLPDTGTLSEKSVFDFALAVDYSNRIYAVWSEYDSGGTAAFYMKYFEKGAWSKPAKICSGTQFYPYLALAHGGGNIIYLLLCRTVGKLDQLVLEAYDGLGWKPERTVAESATHIFDYRLAAAKATGKIYVVFGDYRERHYFPYVLTGILSGHFCDNFGKLFFVEGSPDRWTEPRRITDSGRFHCSGVHFCLHDESDRLHFVWEDGRHGFDNASIFYDCWHDGGFKGNESLSAPGNGGMLASIVCDKDDKLCVAWSAVEEDRLGKLLFRRRIGNRWENARALAGGGFISSLMADGAGNIHFLWGDGMQLFYKINNGESWTRTVTMQGEKANMCVDIERNVHFIIQRQEGSADGFLMHKVLRPKRICQGLTSEWFGLAPIRRPCGLSNALPSIVV